MHKCEKTPLVMKGTPTNSDLCACERAGRSGACVQDVQGYPPGFVRIYPDMDAAMRLCGIGSVMHLEGRTVLRTGAPPVIEPRGGDAGVAEPLLHLGDVGLMIERVGGGSGTQRVGTDLKA